VEPVADDLAFVRKCRLLWLTVILRAKEEAAGGHVYEEDNAWEVKREALAWLTGQSEEFYAVVDLAGLSRMQGEMIWRK